MATISSAVAGMPVARRSYVLDKTPVLIDEISTGTEEVLVFTAGGVLKRKLRIIEELGHGGIGSVFLTEDVTVERRDEKPMLSK